MEKLRFFLVDDDRIFIKRLSRILDPIAQEVISTTTATDAVSSILETRPDCVLLDLMMPGADGLQILKQLRSYESLQSLTIIMVTHEPDMADYAERLIWMVDGRIERDTRKSKAA